MKNFSRTLTSAAVMLSTLGLGLGTANAEIKADDISANVAITTNYLFRGISQTGDDDVEPALQGGFDYAHDSGFYLGTWASNVELADPNGDIADLEMDFYGGYATEVGGIGVDVGVLYFFYPGTEDLDFIEYYGGVSGSVGPADLGLSVNFSPDYFLESGDAVYIDGSLDLPLPNGFGLGLHLGYQAIDEEDTFGTDDYLDWKVGISKSLAGMDFEVAYMDTDLDDDDCFGGTDFCDARAVFTASKSF